MKEFRKLGFSIKDFLGGGRIRAHLAEIDSVLNEPNSTESTAIRNKYLEQIVKHAIDFVPYYQNKNYKYFQDLPVINKNLIRDQFDEFRSVRYVDKSLFKVSTSGSTGIPFNLYHSAEKRHRNTADVLHFMQKCEYQMGNTLIDLEVWREHNKKSTLINFLQNTVQFDVTRLNNERIEEFLKILKKRKGSKNLLGFASAFESICKYLDKRDISFEDLNIEGIIANSEYLNRYTREALERIFKAPVFSRYSNEEMGILAHQTCDSGQKFCLNWASYYFEILDMEYDIPAKKGELGRIVVSDLFNYAMPTLRYDTGDVGLLDDTSSKPNYLKSVEGRKMDIVYDTSGERISSFVIYTLFYPYYEILNQYQFLQTGKKQYVIRLNLDGRFEYEQEMVHAVRREFGSDAEIQFEYLKEIPALASGKRRKVVNLSR